MEIFRHHADDHVRLAVQLYHLAVQFGFEPVSPQAIADDGYVGGSGPVLTTQEIAACCQTHTECPEEVRADAGAVNSLGDIAAGEVELARSPSG